MVKSQKQISFRRIIAVLLGLFLVTVSFLGFASFSPVPVEPNWGSGPAEVDYFPLMVGISFLLPALSLFAYVYFSSSETEFGQKMQNASGCFGVAGFFILMAALVFLFLVLINFRAG
jgi:hypothetical protein